VPAHATGVFALWGRGQSREGASVSVVSEQAGNFIVQVKGANVALDRSVASKIIVA